MSIAFVSAQTMSRTDPETHLLVEEIERLGGSSEVIPWDAAVNWAEYSLVVIRSPWDYHERIDEFRHWAAQVAQVTRLLNPWSVIDWNSHKSYLLDLHRAGVPVMPTQLIRQGSALETLEEHDGLMIIKPAVGIGASGIARGHAADESFRDHLSQLLLISDVLAQPYNPSIEEQGEVSLIFVAGEYSHAVRKIPATGDFRVQKKHGGSVVDHEPTSAERSVAKQTLSTLEHDVAYARVDLVDWSGSPAVMELELIEPELFLGRCPSAVKKFSRFLLQMIER